MKNTYEDNDDAVKRCTTTYGVKPNSFPPKLRIFSFFFHLFFVSFWKTRNQKKNIEQQTLKKIGFLKK